MEKVNKSAWGEMLNPREGPVMIIYWVLEERPTSEEKNKVQCLQGTNLLGCHVIVHPL